MSFFNKLKKIISGGEDSNNPSTSGNSNTTSTTTTTTTTDSKHNEYEKNIFVNGISGNKNVTSVAFDNVLFLCAVGFNDGTFKIFGKNGYEIVIKGHTNNPIKKLIFITNSPYIIALTHSVIEKWDYSTQTLNNVLIYKTRITAVYFATGLKHLFFSTEDSIIQIYNVQNNHLSNYQIYLPPSQDNPNEPVLDQKTSSIFPSCIKICPYNPVLMLIGYSNGLVIVMNIEIKRIEKRYDSFTQNGYCTSLSWSRKGTKFVCGFLNGEIYYVNYPKGTPVCIYKTPSTSNEKMPYVKPIDGLEIIYTISAAAASTHSSSTSSNNLLPSRKFILFRGTFNDDQKSLMMIKGDKLNDPDHLSTIQIASNVTSFHAVTSSPYYDNNGNLLSILAVQHDNLIEYVWDPKSFLFTGAPIPSIYFKSFKNIPDVSIMKSYPCSAETINLISQLAQYAPNYSSCINGGSQILDFSKQTAVPPKSCQLLITAEKNNQIKFWNSTDPKNTVYLGGFNIKDTSDGLNTSGGDNSLNCEITTLSFNASTLLLTISINNLSTNDSSLLIYHISDYPKKIKTAFYLASKTSQQQQQDEKQGEKQQDEKQQDEKQQDEKQEPSSHAKIYNPVIKFMGEIKFNGETVTSIAMNSYKTSYSTRILLGTSSSVVYHFIVSITNNMDHSENSAPSNYVLYSLSIVDLGSTEQLSPNMFTLSSPQKPSPSQQLPEETPSSITSISFCFYPIRENDIDSSIVYLGNSDGYIFVLDLQTMKINTLFKQNVTCPVESIQFLNKKGEPISYLFFGSIYHDDAEDHELLSSLSNLSLSGNSTGDEFKPNIDDILVLISSRKEISLYSIAFGPQKSIQNKRISKHEYKNHPLIGDGAYLTTFPSDNNNPAIMTLDNRGHIEIYNPANLEKISNFSISSIINTNNILSSQSLNIKFSVSKFNCNSFIYLYDNNQKPILYCLCLNKNELNQFPSLFVDNVPMPPQVKKQSVLRKLFSSTMSPEDQIQVLDDKFQEGVEIPNPNYRKANSAGNRQVMEVAHILQETKEKLERRGQVISDIAVKSEEMENNAKNFAALTRQLAKK
ncbi:hypothetical protein DICPUDRAFT_51969 [Dictyostelium purpureum]|uniref:V-SNARE coiled-coil homology domain-containing protein n=1 Tax=Dictyostelium purpureum TaxID=5786 RepID=F0Z653_DICPU|nr:uncharacterized protein DICPUDRAFT_51969 [Dictyostelium purpureum]EGC40595.1 hypothetical protein DICPUDRAFT_51969 [Dictyostelium purpureum]|eukprot:XP_003282931.1 hypothetical protein DICPUDRAFT_51969 [Dictyostelium purpureum]